MIKTKQELLNHFTDINAMYNNPFMYQTLSNMIDELLEQQPCEDAISRATLLEELGEEPFNWNDSPEALQEVRDYQWFKSLVENAPPVTPEAKWIPVSEKLPEPLTAVLLYVKYKSSGQWTYQLGMWDDNKMAWEDWRTPYQLEEEFEVIAWMELPERYEEGEDE